MPADEPTLGADDAPVTRTVHEALTRGSLVGRYVVLSHLGAGGMGVVYAAYDPELDRKVALKLLRPTGGDREVARTRLQREAQAMARLSHPNVVTVHDVGVWKLRVYVAMEFVRGRTATQWLSERDRSWREVVDVFVQAGRGLVAAHAEDLLHRDVKPDNLMVDDAGRVRVMDFGLARTLDTAQPEPSLDDEEDSVRLSHRGASAKHAVLTQAGAIMGTPAYMAPEQFEGGEVDERTDQFSLCVSLWEALYGERPFAGESLVDLCAAVTGGERRPPPAGSKVPAWLRGVVERGLSADPDQRWPTMQALLAELSRDPVRRRAWWFGGAAALTAGSVAAGAWWRHDAELCSRADGELAKVWNDERRDAVRSSILGTEVSFAPEVWERAGPQLDAWAQAWAAMHTEACEATRRTREQSEAVMDLRMACLVRARQGLDAAARVLGHATPDVLQNAHEVVAGLPRLSRCADIEALLADIEPPDADEAETVDAIQAHLAEAAALHMAGDFDAAFEAVERADAMLEGVRYEPVHTEVDLRLGLVQDSRGKYDEALGALQRAQKRAARWKQYDALRDATARSVVVLGFRQQRHAEALAMRELAAGLAAGVPEAEADVHSNLALVLQAQGNYARAESEQRAALALWLEAPGEQRPNIATSRNNLADVLRAQGKYAEAESEQRAAVALWVEALGEQHPTVATSHGNLANVLKAQGKYAEAESEHRTALALMLEALGEDHPEVASTRNNLAETLRVEGKYAEAESELRTALALTLEALGEHHPGVAQSRNSLATVLYAQGKYAEAESELRTALALRLEALGEHHPDVAQSRNNLAAILHAQGNYAQAESEYRASLALWVEVLGEHHPDVAASRNNLAEVLRAQGKYAQAEPEHRAALALWLEALGENHPNVAAAQTNLARTLLAQGKNDEALQLLQATWSRHERNPLPTGHAAKVAFIFAKALWVTQTDRDRARALARQAADLYRQAETPDTDAVEEVEQWLGEHGGGE